MRQSLNPGLLKLPEYEVTGSAANHVFTEGGIHKRVVSLTQPVTLICCALLKTPAESKGAENLRIYLSLTKSQELARSVK